MSFRDDYFYKTKHDEKTYIFQVLEFHRGEYIVREFSPTREIKPVNLKNDNIVEEMTKDEFKEKYPEYII